MSELNLLLKELEIVKTIHYGIHVYHHKHFDEKSRIKHPLSEKEDIMLEEEESNNEIIVGDIFATPLFEDGFENEEKILMIRSLLLTQENTDSSQTNLPFYLWNMKTFYPQELKKVIKEISNEISMRVSNRQFSKEEALSYLAVRDTTSEMKRFIYLYYLASSFGIEELYKISFINENREVLIPHFLNLAFTTIEEEKSEVFTSAIFLLLKQNFPLNEGDFIYAFLEALASSSNSEFLLSIFRDKQNKRFSEITIFDSEYFKKKEKDIPIKTISTLFQKNILSPSQFFKKGEGEDSEKYIKIISGYFEALEADIIKSQHSKRNHILDIENEIWITPPSRKQFFVAVFLGDIVVSQSLFSIETQRKIATKNFILFSYLAYFNILTFSREKHSLISLEYGTDGEVLYPWANGDVGFDGEELNRVKQLFLFSDDLLSDFFDGIAIFIIANFVFNEKHALFNFLNKNIDFTTFSFSIAEIEGAINKKSSAFKAIILFASLFRREVPLLLSELNSEIQSLMFTFLSKNREQFLFMDINRQDYFELALHGSSEKLISLMDSDIDIDIVSLGQKMTLSLLREKAEVWDRINEELFFEETALTLLNVDATFLFSYILETEETPSLSRIKILDFLYLHSHKRELKMLSLLLSIVLYENQSSHFFNSDTIVQRMERDANLFFIGIIQDGEIFAHYLASHKKVFGSSLWDAIIKKKKNFELIKTIKSVFDGLNVDKEREGYRFFLRKYHYVF